MPPCRANTSASATYNHLQLFLSQLNVGQFAQIDLAFDVTSPVAVPVHTCVGMTRTMTDQPRTSCSPRNSAELEFVGPASKKSNREVSDLELKIEELDTRTANFRSKSSMQLLAAAGSAAPCTGSSTKHTQLVRA